MIYPEFIKKGDTIGITAPSAGSCNEIDINRIELATKNFNKIGYSIKETPDCKTENTGRSASAVKRAQELEALYKDENVKMIMGLTGGDFLVEMLNYIDEKTISKNIKWIQGYSDMTGLLFPITTKLDIATLYANNFRTFSRKKWHESLNNNIEILNGNILTQNSFEMYEKNYTEMINGDEEYNLDTKVNWVNVKGKNEIKLHGRMIGGCLDVILTLIATPFDNIKNFIEKYKEDGIIWFFDCCDLTSDDLIRAMWQFKEAGYFKYTKGIIFGRNATEKSSYNVSFLEAIQTSFKDENFPIIADADIGHKSPQMTIINGAITDIYSANGKGNISFELK